MKKKKSNDAKKNFGAQKKFVVEGTIAVSICEYAIILLKTHLPYASNSSSLRERYVPELCLFWQFQHFKILSSLSLATKGEKSSFKLIKT